MTGKRQPQPPPVQDAWPAGPVFAVATGLLLVHLACWCATRNTVRAGPLATSQTELRLDPNRASEAELALLPRIGSELARNIVTHRESTPGRPAFRAAEDLQLVPRIGPVTVEALRSHLRFDSQADTATDDQEGP